MRGACLGTRTGGPGDRQWKNRRANPPVPGGGQGLPKAGANTGQSTPPPGAQLLPEWLKYAACMRAHGIVNYPDPKPIGNYGVMVQIPKSLQIDQSSPQFLAANKACQPLLKGNAPGGG